MATPRGMSVRPLASTPSTGGLMVIMRGLGNSPRSATRLIASWNGTHTVRTVVMPCAR